MIEYSGRTTSLDHKRSNWKSKGLNIGKECIRKVNFFDVQWSNCPIEVEDAVKELWDMWELGNDHYFIKWNWDFENSDEYPKGGKVVGDFLRSKGFKEGDGEEIIIYWWW